MIRWFLLLCFLFPILTARAEETHSGYFSTAKEQAVPENKKETPGFSVVTSLDECLEKLPEKDRADIRANYSRPYQECLRRRYALEKKTASTATGDTDDKTDEIPPLPPGWKFIKVQTDDKENTSPAGEKK